jgi:hypothetical protein
MGAGIGPDIGAGIDPGIEPGIEPGRAAGISGGIGGWTGADGNCGSTPALAFLLNGHLKPLCFLARGFDTGTGVS